MQYEISNNDLLASIVIHCPVNFRWDSVADAFLRMPLTQKVGEGDYQFMALRAFLFDKEEGQDLFYSRAPNIRQFKKINMITAKRKMGPASEVILENFRV